MDIAKLLLTRWTSRVYDVLVGEDRAMAEYDEWPELMTPAEVGTVLRCAPGTVRRWIRVGIVPGIYLGGRWMLRKEDVKALLNPRPVLAGGRIHPGTKAR